MTCGAAASLVISLKAIVEDASDEVILVAPFFPEYTVFVQNAGAKSVILRPIRSTSRFLSMPWNRLLRRRRGPSSSIRRTIRQASSIRLKRMKSWPPFSNENRGKFGHPIYLISDEPYREIIYDGLPILYVPKFYRDTIICYSYSKSLSLPVNALATSSSLTASRLLKRSIRQSAVPAVSWALSAHPICSRTSS